MPTELLIISLVVFVCSLIQSMFGVGILLFGTPTLLLLGYSFDTVLFYLLPCSIAVNVMQVAGSWKSVTWKRTYIYYCLPFVILSLFIVLRFNQSIDIKKYVGILMIITALLRISHSLRPVMSRVCRKYLKASLVIIGGTHGFTNMGGGFLSLLASSLFTEKKEIRSNIAYGYLMMALCQFVLLGITGHRVIGLETVLLVGIAIISYLVIGNRIYIASSILCYQRILTAFISIFGIMLLLT